MRKVIVWMQMSLDGFIEGPKREFDWPVVREELFKYFNDELPRDGRFPVRTVGV